MRIALVTTTIHVPRVLRWYRACGTAQMFVAMDRKTDPAAYSLVEAIENATVLPPERQEEWKCSEPIGWNSIQRRNIAFLEAIKWGADVIVSVDDDNLPLNPHYFEDFGKVIGRPFNGLMATVAGGNFFDVGDFLFPKSKQRGVPHDNVAALEVQTVIGAAIGVAQGLCIGHPDVDAATRYVNNATVHTISEIARAGIVVNNKSRTIWNSQNTAIRRELLPAWGMISGVGRMDDIYASVICNRVMREYGYYAHYGKPMVFQQRNADHTVVNDMRKEIDGYANVKRLARVLENTVLAGTSVLEDCRRVWRTLSTTDIFPAQSFKAMEAYLDDCEGVL